VPDHELAEVVSNGKLRATADVALLGAMDVIDICVPTPLRKTKDPDMSYVVKAVEAVAATARPGQLVILESTTYPGTTDELVQPALEACGLKPERDFFLAFSPERVDPGNGRFVTKNIPKVVGASAPRASRRPRCCIARSSRASYLSARPGSPRWSSCSRTRSAR
jgi:UDP-N-acetyl-D-glucosamine dehydrogenase